MFKVSIGKKLWFLTLMMLGILVFVEYHNTQNTRILKGRLTDVGSVQLPKVRAMTLADMMHDALRSAVYSALVAKQRQDAEAFDVALNEYQEFKANMAEQLNLIDKLNRDEKNKAQLQKARVEVESYVASGQALLDLLVKNKIQEGFAQLPAFQEKFESLEGSMEKLGDDIEKAAEKSVQTGEEEARKAELLTFQFAVIGVIIGLFFSTWINWSLVRKLRGMVRLLGQQKETLKVSTEAIEEASSELSTSVSEQASALQQTASSVEEIHSMVVRTDENSQKLAQNAQNSAHSVDEGQEALNQVVEQMNAIDQANTQVLNHVSKNREQMNNIIEIIHQIGAKTQVINDIVFQTRILSFNASIEAARAGQQGKGFAVVAEEVGKLAALSGAASQEISKMLEEGTQQVTRIVESNTTHIAGLMQQSAEKVENGKSATEKCGQVFRSVVDEVHQVTSLTREIASAIRQQTTGLQEINKAVQMLNTSTERSAGSAESNSAVVDKLRSQFSGLNKLMVDLETMVDGKSQSREAGTVVNISDRQHSERAA